ncbi:MAG: glycosyltransferase [Candidatus Fermentibacteraceae bacterium]|nr:glycosyltransferase [Candidatus Fermentibacteraceae bacterium]
MNDSTSSTVRASVIIPSYNDSEKLIGCLEALDSQSIRKNLQIIVSLDGGNPLPPQVEEKADLIVEGSHSGPASARNRGWRSSNAEYILFTDSDCVPEADWAAKMLSALEEGADAVKGAYSNGGSLIIQRLAQIEFMERYRLLSKQEDIDLVDTYSAAFRREALERVAGFDESFPMPDHEDVDLSYRIRAMGMSLKFEPDALVAHKHRDTWGAYFRMKVSRGRWRIKVLRKFPNMTGGGSYTPFTLKLQIILCMLLPVVFILSLMGYPLYAGVWVGCIFISSIPLTLIATGKEPSLAPILPLFVIWRGCALSSGILLGIFTAGKAAE